MKTRFAVVMLLLMALSGAVVLAQGGEDSPVTQLAVPPNAEDVSLTVFADGFSRPVLVTHAGDESGRLFVVEQGGKIFIVDADGVRLDQPFLNLAGISTSLGGNYSERGLLGLAFHPDYAENGRIFVNYTDANGTTIISEFAVSADDSDVVDITTRQDLLWIAQPFANHNGGDITFGPDGYLYIASGDGGSAGDPQNNGQNLNTLLGTILRIDVDADPLTPYVVPEDNPFVDNDGAAPEIWAWGLRNPWRISFDRATGDLYIADVGQNLWEEVNFQPAESEGGENYGWARLEGTHPYDGAAPADAIQPVAEYQHGAAGCSISGGYVYRGEALPALQGAYFFGDWCSGNIWAMYRDEADIWQHDLFIQTPGMLISGFGQDEAGELYVVDYNGRILRFDPVE